MKVIKLNTPFEISVVPRTMLTQSDDTLVFTAINEFSQVTFSNDIPWLNQNGRIVFEVPDNSNYKAGNKYEIYIKRLSDEMILYRGKMIVVKEDTDIQNYTPSKQTTQRFK